VAGGWLKQLRGSALIGLALVCVSAAGCGGCTSDPDAYPDEFQFLSRQDWLVEQLPPLPPTEITTAGQLDRIGPDLAAKGGKALNPATIPAELRTSVDQYLRQAFGSPAAPFANDESSPWNKEQLAEGSRLFRRNCQHCHGLNGDGRGPTGEWTNPHPRDFRNGVFKFVSTKGTSARKATRADLYRTISTGIPTTAMPSFDTLSEADRERLVDYVQYLSVRGRVEYELLKGLILKGEEGIDGDVASFGTEILQRELASWKKAESDLMQIPAVKQEESQLAESIRRGHLLFLDAKGAACVTCHLDYGRQSKLQYDQWGTVLTPANLTDNKRKGGKSDSDYFRRIHGGIGPSLMPAATSLTETQLWDLIRFVSALPYPDQLPPEVKSKVYPE
jgi:mono/diheme cytochrome c family protein